MPAKQVIKKTLQALPSKTSRRNYLKTLGIKFNDSKSSFESISGGAAGDIDLEDFICPITQCIFIQPVVAADGFTYEKTSLDRLDMYPIRTSSGVVLTHRNYVPNMIVRNAIRHLVSQMARNPEIKKFFEENWNFDLARELGIPIFTVPAVISGSPVARTPAQIYRGFTPVQRDSMNRALDSLFDPNNSSNEDDTPPATPSGSPASTDYYEDLSWEENSLFDPNNSSNEDDTPPATPPPPDDTPPATPPATPRGTPTPQETPTPRGTPTTPPTPGRRRSVRRNIDAELAEMTRAGPRRTRGRRQQELRELIQRGLPGPWRDR